MMKSRPAFSRHSPAGGLFFSFHPLSTVIIFLCSPVAMSGSSLSAEVDGMLQAVVTTLLEPTSPSKRKRDSAGEVQCQRVEQEQRSPNVTAAVSLQDGGPASAGRLQLPHRL